MVAARQRGYVCVAAPTRSWPRARTPSCATAVLGSALTVPDGQPLVWALNALGHRLADRVYGPDAHGRATASAPRDRHAACSSTAAATRARSSSSRGTCARRYPGCRSSAATSPPFRPLTGRGARRRRRPRSTRPAPTSSGSASASPSRRSGWPRCASASTRRCSSASAPRSTSTPASSPRRRRWMQEAGLEWAFRLAHEPRRLGGATCATTRASSLGFARQYAPPQRRDGSAAALASGPHGLSDVAVIGCGRVGLPLALAFADRGLRRDRHRQRPRAPGRRARRAACRSTSPARPRCSRGSARRGSITGPTASPTRPAPATSSSRSARRRSRTSRSTCATSAAVLDDLLPLLRPGHVARPALDDRAGDDGLRRRLPGQAPRLRRSARTSSSPTSPSGSPRAASSRRSRRCRASSAASASAPARPPPSSSRSSARRSCRRRRSRPSWRRSGRTSCATRCSRCPTG